MVWYILLILILNFAIGVAAAIAVQRQLAVPRAEDDHIDMDEELDRLVSQFEQFDEGPEEEFHFEIPAPVAEEIPTEWLDQLEAESIESKSFVEASVQVLRLEVGRYRDQLMSIEQRVQQCLGFPDPDMLRQLLAELKEVNVDWMAKQADAAQHLGGKRGGLGDFEEMGGSLEDVLLDQAAQIETTCSNIDMLDFATDTIAGCQRLVIEVCRLVDLAHNLRDRMQDSLVTIMRSEKRLESLERRMKIDGWTGLLNRSGFETVIYEWWRDDVARQRLATVALIDIDRLGKQNERSGTRRGDALLGAFGKLINDLTEKGHGFTRSARFEGQQFAIFFGDTGPRNATGAVERMRQTIESTTFMCGEEEIELTVSCGVTEVQKDDNPSKLYKRLKKALRSAKKAGRNQTALDEGHGASPVEPPQFQVKGRIVRVEEST